MAFEKSNRLSLIGWLLVFALSFYFIYNNALRYFYINDTTIYNTGFKPFTPFMIAHVLGGMIALIIGPLQFIPFIRNKYRRFHKTTGKIFLLSILVSGLAATYLSIFDSILRNGRFSFGTGTLGLVLAWFITGGMAFWAIKKRNFIQHKEWMIRCYVVTSGFTVFRLIVKALVLFDNLPYLNGIDGISAWACWALPLLITEFILQANKIKRGVVRTISS